MVRSMRFQSFSAITLLLIFMTSCASTQQEELDERAMDLRIRNVMQEHRAGIEECYTRTTAPGASSTAKKPPPRGLFQLAIGIGPTGDVLETSVISEGNTLKNKEIENCVSTLVKKMQFGKMGAYDRYNVTYPFQFN